MRYWVLLIAGALIVVACGAALDEAIDGEDVFGTPPPTNEDGGVDTGAGQAGSVTVTADPAETWVEVNGQTIVYEAVGAINYSCDISEDQVVVNYQRDAGQDFLLQGGQLDGGWILNLTFTVEDEDNIQYGATIPGDGSLGIGDGQLSYEGPVERIENRDILNPTIVDASIAVNCSAPEGQPTAVIAGTEYVVSTVGAASVECEITDELVRVQVNRLIEDGTNIDIGLEAQDGGWFGHVAVTTPDGNYVAKDSPNPVGVVVDGSTVSYEGLFEGDVGEVEGSVVADCS